MRLEINDVIKINQKVFEFLYQFRHGNTAFGAECYIVTKITPKYYYFKECYQSSGLSQKKTLLKVDIEKFDHMSSIYPFLVEKLQDKERIDVLSSILLGQMSWDRIRKQVETPEKIYLEELIEG